MLIRFNFNYPNSCSEGSLTARIVLLSFETWVAREGGKVMLVVLYPIDSEPASFLLVANDGRGAWLVAIQSMNHEPA